MVKMFLNTNPCKVGKKQRLIYLNNEARSSSASLENVFITLKGTLELNQKMNGSPSRPRGCV